MTSARVAVDLLSLTPRAARALAEDGFGARLRGWIVRSGATFTDVAAALSIDRARLYDIFEGRRKFWAAWFALLPAAVLHVALQDLAGDIGEQLGPIPVLDDAAHDDRRQGADLIREATDVIRVAASNTAGEAITLAQAEEGLRELAELKRELAKWEARLIEVRDDRGAPLRLDRVRRPA